MTHRGLARLVVTTALAVTACGDPPPPEVGGQTEGSSGSTGAGSSGTTALAASTSSTGPAADASSGPGSGEGTGSSTTSGALDSTGTSEGTTVALEGSGSSGESTTGGAVSPVGCADGTREALLDELAFPSVAACAGGFWVPGVAAPVPTCDRQGGNDGPTPDGMGCSIEDLCAAGWHLCASRHEVDMAGLGDCGAQAWNGQFFATGQSGNGNNACADTGTNDVFGCGDVGYGMVQGCAPLNRSTGNLCLSLPGPWSCRESDIDEVSSLTKTGPGEGGALCCRDGA